MAHDQSQSNSALNQDDPPTTPVLPAGMPEGWALDRDLPCPTCRYNLRMLRSPRCPECGLVFRWQALLRVFCPRCGAALFTTDAAECPRCKLPLHWPRLLHDARDQDRRLFEYGDQPVRAALRTWVQALQPWAFWGTIPLESPPVIRRLVWLRRAAVGGCLLGVALGACMRWDIFSAASWTPMEIIDALPVLTAVFMLPLVTTIGLPLFVPTLARFRIRRDQLLRCLCYATAGLFWIGVGYVLGFLCALTINTFWARPATLWGRPALVPRVWFDHKMVFDLAWSRGGMNLDPWNVLLNTGLAVVTLLFGFVWWWSFLYLSLRRYLRLDRDNALALFLSTQVIGLLLLLLVLATFTEMATYIGVFLLWLQGLIG
jgi:hypothetical protein